MNNYSIEVKDLVKFYGRRLIFNGINLKLDNGHIYGIAGPNGSGKSTFVKILAQLISPTKGSVIHSLNNKNILDDALHNHIGFVSPYLFLYDEFNAEENLKHFMSIRGLVYDEDYAHSLLKEFGLFERKKDLVRAYSSGMKQRLKFVFALCHKPSVLILDEPTSNLDNEGKEKVYEMVKREKADRLILIASNEDTDLLQCESVVDLEKFKTANGKK